MAHLAAGDHDEAMRYADDALGKARRHNMRPLEAASLVTMAQVHRALGARRPAAAHAAEAEAVFAMIDQITPRAELAELRAWSGR